MDRDEQLSVTTTALVDLQKSHKRKRIPLRNKSYTKKGDSSTMQHTSFPAPATTDTGTIALSQQVLHFFEQVLVPSSQKAKHGHLQLSHLLLTCLLMLLRQTFSPPAIQHALMTETVGPFASLSSISRQAVRQRLIAIGITPFTQLLQRVQQALPQR